MASSTPVQERAQVPTKHLDSPYPLIDSDPHIKRVLSYTRPSDWVKGAGIAAIPPGLLLAWERFTPSLVGKGGFAPVLRMNVAVGLVGGLFFATTQTSMRFYGFKENRREEEMDMREMVDKVKKGESLYGESKLTPYMQGVASRNSRYSGIFLYAMPWFNFVNHSNHGIDTAKYFLQAEQELETEGKAKA